MFRDSGKVKIKSVDHGSQFFSFFQGGPILNAFSAAHAGKAWLGAERRGEARRGAERRRSHPRPGCVNPRESQFMRKKEAAASAPADFPCASQRRLPGHRPGQGLPAVRRVWRGVVLRPPGPEAALGYPRRQHRAHCKPAAAAKPASAPPCIPGERWLPLPALKTTPTTRCTCARYASRTMTTTASSGSAVSAAGSTAATATWQRRLAGSRTARSAARRSRPAQGPCRATPAPVGTNARAAHTSGAGLPRGAVRGPLCLNQTSCIVPADLITFNHGKDPCYGVVTYGVVELACGPGGGPAPPAPPSLPPLPPPPLPTPPPPPPPPGPPSPSPPPPTPPPGPSVIARVEQPCASARHPR